MAFRVQETYHKLAQLLAAPTVEPSQRAIRIQSVERDVVLPLRALVICILGYFLFLSDWHDVARSVRENAIFYTKVFFWCYLAANIGAGFAFVMVKQMSLRTTQWLIVGVGLLDVILMSSLTFITDGWASDFYGIFLVLILHNALAIPLALPQIFINFAAIVGFLTACILEKKYITDDQILVKDRIIVPFIWAGCFYGIQVLFERQRRAEAEATEFAVRQERLRTAGRLAAEIAHKIKNPLGIITNAAFCLQRDVDDGKYTDADEQIDIIREEVEKADEILTELMGYAQLAEGRVEKLIVAEELQDAHNQVFPPGAKYNISVRKNFAPGLPALLMQRQHLSSILVNLMQNAREAMNGVGEILLTTRTGENDSVIISVTDNGPGIPPDKLDKIFEAYFTTRAKGTGLGLAIVKHNTEMYGGIVRVQSEPGQGTCFTLEFPARVLMRLTE